MHTDPDYSAAYVILQDRRRPRRPRLHVHDRPRQRGLRRGDPRLRSARRRPHARARSPPTRLGSGDRWPSESQLRWLGPEKGVIHIAMAAIVNAVWDLHAKAERKPVWKLLADMTPRQIVACIDFRYITDALTPDEALAMLERQARDARRSARRSCCATATRHTRRRPAGWAIPTSRSARLCREAVADGWTHFKVKVGGDPADDARRVAPRARGDRAGPPADDRREPALGRRRSDRARAGARARSTLVDRGADQPGRRARPRGDRARRSRRIGVATGEHCANRVMFKQLLQASAIGFCQIDSCRLGGVNENLAVMLMAAKFGVPVCPHAGGVGLCELRAAPVDVRLHRASRARWTIASPSSSITCTSTSSIPWSSAAARYVPPTAPGYSSEIKAASRAEFRYPDGPVWKASQRQA